MESVKKIVAPPSTKEVEGFSAQVQGYPSDKLIKNLLVEDSEDNRLLIKTFLSFSSYRLDMVANRQERFDRCKKASYDLPKRSREKT